MSKLSGIQRKIIIIAAVIIAVATIAAVATVAYLWTKTPPVENTFDPVSVSCKVNETFDGTTKSNVTVTNTGDISAYVRATVLAMWIDGDGNIHGGSTPVEGKDYTAVYGDTRWVKGTDGYYYYTSPLSASGTTAELIKSLSPVSESIPDGCTLRVQVIASAIQAEPAAAVTESWGVAVGNGGELSIQ